VGTLTLLLYADATVHSVLGDDR